MAQRFFQPSYRSDMWSFHLTLRDAESVVMSLLLLFQTALMTIAAATVPEWLPWYLGGIVLWILGAATSRRGVLVTREGAWGQIRFFGLPVRSYALGIRPKVEDAGFNWSEIALVPEEPSLRQGLHDDERFVLATWDSGLLKQEYGQGEKSEAGHDLMRRLRREIERLHPAS